MTAGNGALGLEERDAVAVAGEKAARSRSSRSGKKASRGGADEAAVAIGARALLCSLAHTVSGALTVCLVWPGDTSKVRKIWWQFSSRWSCPNWHEKWFVNYQLRPCRVLVLAYAALLEMVP